MGINLVFGNDQYTFKHDDAISIGNSLIIAARTYKDMYEGNPVVLAPSSDRRM